MKDLEEYEIAAVAFVEALAELPLPVIHRQWNKDTHEWEDADGTAELHRIITEARRIAEVNNDQS